MNGYLGIIVILILLALVILNIFQHELVIAFIFLGAALVLITGITVNQPNEAIVVLLLGHYIGSVRKAGIVVVVPFSKQKKISLRTQTLTNPLFIMAPTNTME